MLTYIQLAVCELGSFMTREHKTASHFYILFLTLNNGDYLFQDIFFIQYFIPAIALLISIYKFFPRIPYDKI